jgi:hypothetical protein
MEGRGSSALALLDTAYLSQPDKSRRALIGKSKAFNCMAQVSAVFAQKHPTMFWVLCHFNSAGFLAGDARWQLGLRLRLFW